MRSVKPESATKSHRSRAGDDDKNSKDGRSSRRNRGEEDAESKQKSKQSSSECHSEDRYRNDRDSKRKAKQNPGDNAIDGVAIGVIVKPGAESVRKSPRKDRSSPDDPHKCDDMARRRAARPSSKASRPGAESSGPQDHKKSQASKPRSRSGITDTDRGNDNGKERGKEFSKDKSKGKNKEKNKAKNNIREIAFGMMDSFGEKSPVDDGTLEIHANVVKDVDDQDIDKLVNQRIQQQMKVERARMQEDMNREAEHLRQQQQEMEEVEAKKARETAARKQRCLIMIAFFLSVVSIGGGLAAFFLTQASEPDNDTNAGPLVVATKAPSSKVVAPSTNPTDRPSTSPSIDLKYDPPSEEDCTSIAEGEPVEGQSSLQTRNFKIQTDLTLATDATDNSFELLTTKIQEVLIPELAGCGASNGRQLRGIEMGVHRHLFADALRYIIGGGLATITMTVASSCTDSEGCIRVDIDLRLYIKGFNEKIFDIQGIILAVFTQADIERVLGLETTYDDIKVIRLESMDDTDQPSLSPSGLPSSAPSSSPSQTPITSAPTEAVSFNPTRAPVIGPADPTDAPTTGTPGPTPSTPSPTCEGIGAYFETVFNEEGGTQNGQYTVSCDGNTRIIAITQDTSTCAVRCLGSLLVSPVSLICIEENEVSFILEGDNSNENVLIGYESSGSGLSCDSTMTLVTSSPTPAPFPGSTPFPTQQPSATPSDVSTKIPSSAPSVIPSAYPSSQPSGRPSLQPSDAPSAFPTSRPTSSTTSSPTSGPTKSPTPKPSPTPSNAASASPTSRLAFLTEEFQGIEYDQQVFDWLVDQDTFVATTTNRWRERHDLALLYYSTQENGWNTETSWMSSESVCDWYGVTCGSGFDRVREIDLTNNDLKGSIPTMIGRLTMLTSLAIGDNDYDGTAIPTEIGLLTLLSYLHIRDSKLVGAIPDEIIELTELTFLNLRSNKFTEKIPTLPTGVQGCDNCRLHEIKNINLQKARDRGCQVTCCGDTLWQISNPTKNKCKDFCSDSGQGGGRCGSTNLPF